MMMIDSKVSAYKTNPFPQPRIILTIQIKATLHYNNNNNTYFLDSNIYLK